MTDLSKHLAARGYAIKVFTSGNSKSNIADGSLSQVEVVRSPYLGWQSQTILGKIANSLLFLVASFAYVVFQVPHRSSILIVSNPPYSGIIGLCLKVFKQGKFYFILQDVFPESAVIGGLVNSYGVLFKFFSYLTYLICKHSRHTIILTNSMKEFLEKKYPALKDRQTFKIIENWSIEDILISEKQRNEFAIQHGLNEIFTVLYSGNLGRLHDIESIAKAAQLLSDRPIQFVFIGDGPKRKTIERYVQEHQLKNVLLLPFQPREMIGQSLTACDISLVSLIKGAEEIIAPCKLYGMLASGRAIVSISSTGSYIDKLLTEYNCGINCPPDSPQQLANFITDLAAAPDRVKVMGKSSRQLYEEKYTFRRALDEYEKLLFDT